MPQIMLPMSWERASLGFMILPAAKTASILGTRTSRLSMSTRISANWAPNAFRDNGFCELISSVVVAALLPAGAHYVKASAAGRIEAPGGDLHQYGFNGEVVDINRARSATAGSAA